MITVGSDGSLQYTKGQKGILLHNPASIPDTTLQQEILSLLGSVLKDYENNRLDPIAVLQAKAKSSYFLERAIVHRGLKEAEG